MALKEQLLDRAQKYVLKGSIDKALGEYKAAFELDPRDISVRLKIGDLFVKSGKKTEAIREYTEVAKANAQRGFYLKAIAVYKQALKLDISNMEIHYKLADLYVKQRLIADAISAYSHILSVFEKKGKTNEVLEIVKKMVEVDPDNIGVRLKLADLYQKMSFDKDALEEYSFIFEKLLSQGKFDVAEKIYIGLYNNNPKEALVIKGLSDLYEKKGDSREHLRFSKTLFNIYRENGDIEGAKEICSSILGMKPEDPDALRFMAQFRPVEEKRVSPPPAPEPTAAQPTIAEPPGPMVSEPVVEVPSIEEAPARKREAAAPEEEAEGPLISLPEDIEITLEGFEEGEEAQAGEGGGVDISEAFFKAPGAETGEGGAIAEQAGAEVEIELPVDMELTPEAGEPEAEITSKAEEAVEKAEAAPEPVVYEKIEFEVEVAPEVVQEPLLESAPEPVTPEKIEFEVEVAPEVVQEPLLESASEPVTPEKIEFEVEVAPEVVQEPLLESASEPVTPEKIEFEVEVAPEVVQEPLLESAPEPAVPERVEFEVEVAPEVVQEPLLESAPEPVTPERVEFEVEVAPEIVQEPTVSEKIGLEAQAPVEAAQEAVEAEKAIEEAIETAFEQTFGAPAEAAPSEAPAAVAETVPEQGPVEEALPAPAALKGDEFAGEEITEEEIESERISSAIDEINRGLEAVVEREAEFIHEAALKEPGAAPETFAGEAGAPQETSLLEGISSFATGPISGMVSEETLIEGGPERPRIEEPQAEARKEEYVDLSAELGMEEALHELSGTWGEGEPEEMVTEFKKGMGEQLGREDTETHYNLGIAYMEMGLFNEASMEFKIALKDQRLEFDCYARLGLCAMHQTNPDEAIVYYLKGLKVRGTSDEERKGIMYELALAYENAGKKEESLQIFKSIYGMDKAYREVAGKVRSAMPAHAAPLIPLDDGLIEVELL